MIRRCPRPTGNFCVINNDVINDTRLSWDSRATLLYLLSKPDHWTVSVANLVNQTIDAIRLASGRDTVYAMLRELMIARYVKRVQLRREDGTMAGVEYIVSELPFEGVDVGDDFLPRKPRIRRRPSRAARSRSFSTVPDVADVADEEAVDAPCGDALPSSYPRESEAVVWAPVDVTPRRIAFVRTNDDAEQTLGTTASPLGDEARPSDDWPIETSKLNAWCDDNATAMGQSLAPAQHVSDAAPDVFSPLTGHPEAVQPDTVNTTQAKTDLKKELIGSKDLNVRARRARSDPKRRSTGRAPEIELFDATTLTARGVDPKVAATWMAVRAKKRAVNSMLALDGVQEQADLAGLSLGEAVKIAAERSWQGFCADWIKRSQMSGDVARRPPRSGAQMTEGELAESMRKAKAELFGEGADGGSQWREPTLLDREGDMWRAPS